MVGHPSIESFGLLETGDKDLSPPRHKIQLALSGHAQAKKQEK
jgi:hypothetical protein